MKIENKRYKTMAGIVAVFEHDFGEVRLTQVQLDWIIKKVEGKESVNMGSTHSLVDKRIRDATGWDMKTTQLVCRFAYLDGIVKL